MSGRRLAPLFAVAALLGAAPAAASAASVQVERDCYFDGGASASAKVAATGFAPGSPLTITLDGQSYPANGAAADATGAISGSFGVPLLTGKTQEAQHAITFTDNVGTSATATFSSTHVTADFTPHSGDPKKLKVRFGVFGMSLVQPNAKVYVHYVAPGGKLKATYVLGTAQGPCGHILKTAKRKMFPFTAKYGLWILQVDTSKTYHKGSNALTYPWAQIGVRVRKIIVFL